MSCLNRAEQGRAEGRPRLEQRRLKPARGRFPSPRRRTLGPKKGIQPTEMYNVQPMYNVCLSNSYINCN